MRIPSAAALSLSACSAPSADPHAQPTRSPAPATSRTAAAVAETATAGRPRTFGDWAVGCDNTALCTVASLGPEGGAFPGVTMALLRQPGPAGAIDLGFGTRGEGAPVTPLAAEVDGRRIALPALGGTGAAAVAAAMANGRALTIRAAGDRVVARFSLRGASAALRWMDAEQGRAGTVTALVARGDRPASAVPERRAAPVIRAVVPTGTAAVPSPPQVAAMRHRAGCEADRPGTTDLLRPEAHALGGGATLVLLPCSAGAYNLSSALFVLRDAGVEPARTDAPTGFDATPAAGLDRLASVVNGVWRNGELTSHAKGRGLGDCGVRQALVWDGQRLRLTEQSEMPECRGNPDFIVTWRAQVVRGDGLR